MISFLQSACRNAFAVRESTVICVPLLSDTDPKTRNCGNLALPKLKCQRIFKNVHTRYELANEHMQALLNGRQVFISLEVRQVKVKGKVFPLQA